MKIFLKDNPNLSNLGATAILPLDYQEVEYLQSTGVQYISLAYNYGGAINTTVEGKVDRTSGTLFGSGWTNHPNRVFYGIKQTTVESGNWNNRINYTFPTGIHEFSLEWGGKFYVDGALEHTFSDTISYTNTIFPIFGEWNGEYNRVDALAIAKMYYFYIKEGDTYKFKLVPCYRRFDNKPGMYDLVTNTFFINQGDVGDFTVGPSIHTPIDISDNAKLNTSALYVKGCSLYTYNWVKSMYWKEVTTRKLLPSEYQEVTYLLSPGVQKISTDLRASTNISTYIEFSENDSYTTWNYFVGGGDSGTWYILGVENSKVASYLCGSYNTNGPVVELGTKHSIYFNCSSQEKKVYYDNTLIATHSVNNTVFQYTFSICAGRGKYYLMKFIDSFGNIIRHLIPCYRKSDSKPGMYDLVTDTFYTNSTSTDFGVGEVQTTPSYIDIVSYIPNTNFKYLTAELGTKSGTYQDFNMFYAMTTPAPTGYGRVNYNNSTGVFSLVNNVPDISGNITFAYRRQGDLSKANAIASAFPNLTTSYTKIIVDFQDSGVESVLRSYGVGDADGITENHLANLTNVGTWFKNNTTITAFPELSSSGVTTLNEEAFSGCSSLTTVGLSKITTLGISTFANTQLAGVLNIPNLSSVGNWYGKSAQFKGTNITSVTSLGNLVNMGENHDASKEGMFENCTSLTSVNLPSTLKVIGPNSFYGCSSLTTITGGGSVEVVGSNAFDSVPITSFDFSAVTTLGVSTFANTQLAGVLNIPNLSSVGTYRSNLGQFKGTNITSITSLGNLVNMSDSTDYNTWDTTGIFQDCTSLTSVVLPTSLKKIGGQSFLGCSSLTTITGGENVEQIHKLAFCDVPITSFDFSSATYIGGRAFKNTNLGGTLHIPNLTSLVSQEYNLMGNFRGTKITSVTSLGSLVNLGRTDWFGRTDLCEGVFEDCTLLQSVVLPDTLVNIMPYCFKGCTSLTTINFPNSLTTIGGAAFQGCALETIDLNHAACALNSSFYGLTSLRSISNIENVTSVNNAFQGCNSLVFEDLNLPGLTTTDLWVRSFYGTTVKKVTSLGAVVNFCYDGHYDPYNVGIFNGQTQLTEVNLNSQFKKFGGVGYDFCNCTSLTKLNPTAESDVNLPETITEINGYAFFNTGLVIENLYLPNLTNIGSKAFYKTVVKKITSLGNITSFSYIHQDPHWKGTFCDQTQLTEVTLPATFTTDNDEAGVFSGCTSLKKLTCLATTPPTLRSNALNGTPIASLASDAHIYVPAESVSAYQQATGWSAYASIISAIPE